MVELLGSPKTYFDVKPRQLTYNNGEPPVIIDNALTQSFGIINGVLGGQYFYNEDDLENNIPPIVDNVKITGTPKKDVVLTITAKVYNDTTYTIQNIIAKIYRATSTTGTSEALVITVAQGLISSDGKTITFTYTPITGDIGFYLTAEVMITLSDGATPNSNIARSIYTNVVAA